MSAAADSARRRRFAHGGPQWWLALCVGCWCLITAGGGMTTTDAVVAYDVTRNLVEHQSVATSANLIGNEAYRGTDGRYYSPFGIAQSIWNIPFYLAGRAVSQATGLETARGTIEKSAVAIATVPAVALLAGICGALLIAAGARPAASVAAVLILIFATPLWPYSKFGFNQPLSACFLWAAVLALETGGVRKAVYAGLLSGLAVLTRHEMLLALPLLAASVVMRERAVSRRLAGYLLGALPALGLWCGLNWWRFGNPFESGYLRDATPQFGSALAAGVWGLLLSGYAALPLYCPVALLAIPALIALRRHRPGLAGLCVALFLTYFLLYASLGNWMGGRSYGPRYLVPFLPALILPLAFWQPRGGLRWLRAAVIALSVAIQIPGVVVDYSKVRMAQAAAGETVAQDMRVERAPLLLNAHASLDAVRRTVRIVRGDEGRPRVHLADADLGAALSFSPDFWWVYLYFLGRIAGWVALAIPVTLALCGWLALRQALSAARSLERARAGPAGPDLEQPGR